MKALLLVTVFLAASVTSTYARNQTTKVVGVDGSITIVTIDWEEKLFTARLKKSSLKEGSIGKWAQVANAIYYASAPGCSAMPTDLVSNSTNFYSGRFHCPWF